MGIDYSTFTDEQIENLCVPNSGKAGFVPFLIQDNDFVPIEAWRKHLAFTKDGYRKAEFTISSFSQHYYCDLRVVSEEHAIDFDIARPISKEQIIAEPNRYGDLLDLYERYEKYDEMLTVINFDTIQDIFDVCDEVVKRRLRGKWLITYNGYANRQYQIEA
jgi:hypothetical protein